MKLSQVYEGWRNHLFPPSHLKEIIQWVGEDRMKICDDCEYHSRFHKTLRPDAHCTDCGCTLEAKTKCLSCECSLKKPKWKAIVSPEEEEEMLPNEITDKIDKDSS